MNSAESVDAFYSLLDAREHLYACRSTSASPNWPAARNDHYCHQEVCRHAVLDLSPLSEPSDADGYMQSPATPGTEYFTTRYDTPPTEYSQNGSYRPSPSSSVDEDASCNVQSADVDRDPSSISRDGRSSQITPKTIDYRLRIRRELDNLQISSAQSYVELEERFIDLSDSYCRLSSSYDRLSESHDRLLDTALKLCTGLSDQAKTLMELNEWKMRTQKSFAEVRVQGQNPQLLYYDTPHSTSTVDIPPEQVEPDSAAAKRQTFKMVVDGAESGVTGLQSPPIPPRSSVAHPRLKLRLPPRPDTAEESVKSLSDLVPDQHARPKRVKTPTQKRKVSEPQIESTRKKAKKCRK